MKCSWCKMYSVFGDHHSAEECRDELMKHIRHLKSVNYDLEASLIDLERDIEAAEDRIEELLNDLEDSRGELIECENEVDYLKSYSEV